MPPAITYDRFERGLDLTKGKSVSDANRLRELQNAYVAPGWNLQKRPGMTRVAELSAGSVGLVGFDGSLHTFSATQDPSHGDTLDNVAIVNHQLPYSGDAGDEAVHAHYADSFNGALYVALEYESGAAEHHYIDGAPPYHITDANCPQTKAVLKLLQKIYAVDGDTVRYSATDAPTDWTTVDDAGFLPTGLRAPGSADALALGEFNGQLVVIMSDAAQIWAVDPDPAKSALSKTIPNVGTRYPRSVHKVAEDLYFLAPVGFRSIAIQQLTENFIDLDVGVPIDPLVRALLVPNINPVSTFYIGGGQYWCAIRQTVFVYTFSRTNKISAWSRYVYPFEVDAYAQLGDKMYVRSGDIVYLVDEQNRTDDSALYETTLELPYLDSKKPGITKRYGGVDVVCLGDCFVAHKFDARDESLITNEIPISGDTRPGPMTPVEVVTTELATRIRNFDDKDFRLDAITYYYEVTTPI
jgi:hypothetical protein